MTFNDLVQLYFERSNALQNYWTVYVLVVGGLLAFSSLRKQGDWLSTLLITVLFSFFAFKNLGAIQDVTLQRQATLQAIKQSGNAKNPVELQAVQALLEPTLVAPPYEGIRNFHLASDLLAIAAIWAMERRRRPQHLL